MKPIKFKEQNCTYAENQPEYLPLPAFRSTDDEGRVISCWKLSFKERIRILFTGKLWVSLMMFGKPLTPSYFTTKKSEVLWVAGLVNKNVKLFNRLLKKNLKQIGIKP